MTAPKRPWTKRTVLDARVEVYVGSYFRYSRDTKAAADELARDLQKLFAEHSDWKDASTTVHTETELQCSFCGREYEEDAEGPVCCDRAIQEFQKLTARTAVAGG